MTARDQVPGSVRAHLERTPAQRVRQWWMTRHLGSVGEGAFVEARVEFLRHPANIRLGAQTIVKSGARLCPANASATIEVGDWTTIGYHSHLFATSGITIGRDCLIAPFCYFVDADHGTERGALIREQPMATAPIVVGDDVWVGAGAVVLAGTTIGTGAVIAAGSVVKGVVEPYTVVAGAPARQISERS